MRILYATVALATALPFAARAAGAQQPAAFEVAVTTLLVDHHHAPADVGFPTLRGTAWGAVGRVRVQWLELGAEYAQGTLGVEGEPKTGELVEGRVTAGTRVTPWLLLRAGARAYELSGTVDRRIVSWHLGSEVSFMLIPEVARGYGGLSAHLGGSVDSADPLRGGAGGEVGLFLTVPTTPLWLSASYRFERDGIIPAPGSDSAERLLMAFGVRFG
jgi:hypothetical protein